MPSDWKDEKISGSWAQRMNGAEGTLWCHQTGKDRKIRRSWAHTWNEEEGTFLCHPTGRTKRSARNERTQGMRQKENGDAIRLGKISRSWARRNGITGRRLAKHTRQWMSMLKRERGQKINSYWEDETQKKGSDNGCVKRRYLECGIVNQCYCLHVSHVKIIIANFFLHLFSQVHIMYVLPPTLRRVTVTCRMCPQDFFLYFTCTCRILLRPLRFSGITCAAFFFTPHL